jgi:hypothetical protein
VLDGISASPKVLSIDRDRGCRLYYYASGHEVQFANAIDQATTFIQGTGHQMEREAIRSRTREALRSRVRNGQIAGGICFGYKLDRKTDGSGRKYTLAVVNDGGARYGVTVSVPSRAGSNDSPALAPAPSRSQ